MLSVLYAVLSFAITQPLANKFGKKEWCCMGAGFAAIVFGILFFFPVHNPWPSSSSTVSAIWALPACRC